MTNQRSLQKDNSCGQLHFRLKWISLPVLSKLRKIVFLIFRIVFQNKKYDFVHRNVIKSTLKNSDSCALNPCECKNCEGIKERKLTYSNIEAYIYRLNI